jgi:hypothetical protein
MINGASHSKEWLRRYIYIPKDQAYYGAKKNCLILSVIGMVSAKKEDVAMLLHKHPKNIFPMQLRI